MLEDLRKKEQKSFKQLVNELLRRGLVQKKFLPQRKKQGNASILT